MAIACKNEPKPIVRTYTKKGNYEYFHHVKNNSRIAQGGDSVVFHYCLRNKEKVISCTQYQNKPVSVTLPPDFVKTKTPLFAGVSSMAAGDSISLFYPLEQGAKKPNGFQDADFVIYDIKVLEIISKEK
jgi:hypothetical protein